MFERLRLNAKDTLMSRVEIDPESGCWIWVGYVGTNGYGTITFENRTRQAHRMSYETFVGPIPEGLDIDHSCHRPETCAGGKSCPHRRCINPDHLSPMTRENNARRGCKCAVTHCPKGHEYTLENTWFNTRGSRQCRICGVASSHHRYVENSERINRIRRERYAARKALIASPKNQ